MDTSNANRRFQAAWREALGPDAPPYTARGGRFGAVINTVETAPESQA